MNVTICDPRRGEACRFKVDGQTLDSSEHSMWVAELAWGDLTVFQGTVSEVFDTTDGATFAYFVPWSSADEITCFLDSFETVVSQNTGAVWLGISEEDHLPLQSILDCREQLDGIWAIGKTAEPSRVKRAFAAGLPGVDSPTMFCAALMGDAATMLALDDDMHTLFARPSLANAAVLERLERELTSFVLQQQRAKKRWWPRSLWQSR